MDRLLVADAVGRTPSSSEFKRLLSSSLKYGLTAGSEKADNIVPTEIGLRIASPQNEQERGQGLIQACLKPELFARILNHYNRSKLPDAAFLKNALQKSFAVDASLAEECATVLVTNAKFCGLIQDISGSKYVRIVEGTCPDYRRQPRRGSRSRHRPSNVGRQYPSPAGAGCTRESSAAKFQSAAQNICRARQES